MIKNTLALLLVSAIFLSSCKDDDELVKDFNYPLTTLFKGIEKGPIEVWTKTNGQLVSVPLDDTILDEHGVFTEIESTSSYSSIVFNSDNEVDFIDSDTRMSSYTCSEGQLTFTESFGSITISSEADGTPEEFELKAQAFVKTSDFGILSVFGLFHENIEDLKSQLEEGDTIAVMNYTEKYSQ